MSTKSVLIVDDNPLDLRLFCCAFEKFGIKTISTDNPNDVLELAAQQQPSYIILDLYMPEKSGMEVCKELKLDHRTREIPVLFITASDSIDDAINSIHMGIIDYIHKPVSINHLVEQVVKHDVVNNVRAAYQPMRDAMQKFVDKYDSEGDIPK
jgi:two-component system, cell cycle response regulator